MPKNQSQFLAEFMTGKDRKVMTEEDFLSAFQQVLNFVKGAKEATDREIAQIKETYHLMISTQGKRHDDASAKLQELFESLGVKPQMDKMMASHQMIISETKQKLGDALNQIAKLKKGKDGLDGLNGKPGKDGSPDSPEQVRNKLESLTEDNRLDASAIKGLEDRLKAVETRPVVISGNTARDIIRETDISTSLDGITKTFNIGAFHRIISIDLSSFPYGSLRKSVDYTYDGNLGTITFGDSISADAQLALGQSCVITFVVA